MAEKKLDKNTKILFTGVHLTPALAVLEELQSRGYKNFVWVGRKQPYILGVKEESLEYKIITQKNIKFVNLITGKIQRTLDITFFKWIVRIPIGFIQAFFILLNERPKIVVTFGSYVGVPISFWAWVMRIKIIVHEQTLIGGLANSFISKFADKVCLSWDVKKYKNKKYIYTGNPIQKSVFESKTNEIVFKDNSRKTILFTTGKAGSHILNQNILSAVEKLVKRYNIIHQTGTNPIADDFAHAEKIAHEVNKSGTKYIPLRHFSGGEVYKKSDLVVARSGANTVYELAALGKISILIPIPFSQKDEQTKNAKLLENTGTSSILLQSLLTPDTLITRIDEIFANYETMKTNVSKAKHLITLDAHKKIANLVEDLLNNKQTSRDYLKELENAVMRRFKSKEVKK